MKEFIRLYLIFFLVLIFVSVFQFLGDGESMTVKMVMQNIQQRLGILLLIFLIAPAFLAGICLLFQSLLSKFHSE